MKIGIIGGGSIGLLISSYLSRHHQITLYVNREEQKRKINKHGITLVKQGDKNTFNQIQTRLMTDIGTEDCYIVCVKQHHLERVFPYLEKIKKPIIFLQNGMGHIRHVKQLQANIYVGVVEHGASRKGDDCVHHLGVGVIKIAAVNERHPILNQLIETLNKTDFQFILEADYNSLLKNKLIINAVINPLTAIFDVPNGAIVMNEHIQWLARQLCKEAAKTLQLDEISSWNSVVKTATITKDNTSSMRADILNKRKTEIEAISGYILELAKDLPYTTFVYHSVLALEKKGTYSDEHPNRI